ncbi:MAG: hypothetical protein WBC85_08495 [Planktotalea sp.]|uniref:hypothetical protein n=1 Tax=Planktotalea sp. TaxID=2029877 RepID=UPI003C74D282
MTSCLSSKELRTGNIMKRLLCVLTLLFLPLQSAAETVLEQIKDTISEALGPPGNEIGEKTQVVAVNSDDNVTFIFMCSAGKDGGVGDLAVDAIFTAIASATGGIPLLAQNPVKNFISAGIINKGDAYCVAIASETGSTRKAKNVANGSIYTTAWSGNKKGETESDERACEKIQSRYLCFEVVEASFSGGKEVDGVSGCFEAEINKKLVSYAFGRGALIPDETKNAFAADKSKSDLGCEARGFGLSDAKSQ